MTAPKKRPPIAHNILTLLGLLTLLGSPATLVSCAGAQLAALPTTPAQYRERGARTPARELTQITGYDFDWDDNIFFMPTKIVVFDRKSGEEKQVSTADFALIREHLGKPGEWENYETRNDDATGSFRNFRDGANGFNPFLTDLLAALDAPVVPGERPKWQGPSWDAFVIAMDHVETAHWTTIITARGHSGEAMLAGLKILKDRGIIKNTPNVENLFAVSNPKYKGTAANPGETKAVIMKQLLDRVQALGINEKMDLVLDTTGKKSRRMHLWGFSDDDFGNIETARKVLSAEMKPNKEYPNGRWPDIKISLFFTGGKNNPTEKPRVMVLTTDGGTRPALAAEIGEAHRVICAQVNEGQLTRP